MLAQGVRDILDTDCISFVHHSNAPKDKKADHSRIEHSIRPSKKETHITRITVGRNVLKCYVNASAKMANLTTLKLLINSVVSTPKAKFMTFDIKNYNLVTILAENHACKSKRT